MLALALVLAQVLVVVLMLELVLVVVYTSISGLVAQRFAELGVLGARSPQRVPE